MANGSGGLAAASEPRRHICFDTFEIDLKTAELRKSGVRITLHQQSFQILVALLQAQGELVTKDDLREILWPSNTFLDFDRSINKAVAKLRTALNDSPEDPRFIETVRDRGYRFLVPVIFKEEPASTFSTNGSGAADTSATDQTEDSTQNVDGLAAFGAFEVDLQTEELRKRGVKIRVHPQSLKLLILLIKHQGQLFTKEELHQQLWPSGTYVDFESSLKKVVSKLRIALGDSVDQPSFIETLPGRGYRFIAPVRYLNKSRNTASWQSSSTAESDVQTQTVQATFWTDHWRITVYISLAALLAICAAAFYLYHHASPRVNTARPSVAVMEFRNLSGNDEEAWLATALSEWTAAELAAGGQLRLVPGDQVMQMQMELATPTPGAPTPATLSKIRQILGTDLVVSGSYRIFAGGGDPQIQVDLQLNDTHSGKVLKVVSETGNQSNLFDLIARIGQHLRQRLGVVTVTHQQARQVAASLPSTSEAAKLYAEALHKQRTGDAQVASDLLQKAAALDPNNPRIHDALATAWDDLGYDVNAKLEAQKAVGLIANLSREDQLLIQGKYEKLSTNWSRAIEIYRTLVEFFPDSLDYGLLLANTQVDAGKPQDGLATISHLRQIPALRDDVRLDMAEAYAAMRGGDAKHSVAAAERGMKKAQASGASLQIARIELTEAWAYMNLGVFDKPLGPLSDAQARYAAAGIEVGEAEAIYEQAIAYNYAVQRERAERLFEQVLAISRRIGYQKGISDSLSAIGDIRLSMGDPASAKARFQDAIDLDEQAHNDYGVAINKNNLGRVFMRLASPVEARKAYEDSLAIYQKMDNRELVALNLLYVAEADFFQAHFDTALSEVNQGIEGYLKMGSNEGAGWGEIVRAEILLDQGHTDEAATTAKHAAKSLAEVKDEPGQQAALNLLAEIFLRQKKYEEARKALTETRTLWNGTKDLETGLAISLNEALLQAASPAQKDRDEAENKIHNLIAEANHMQYMVFVLGARFELARLEFKSGRKAAAMAHLMTLAKDADAKGMGLITWKVVHLGELAGE